MYKRNTLEGKVGIGKKLGIDLKQRKLWFCKKNIIMKNT